MGRALKHAERERTWAARHFAAREDRGESKWGEDWHPRPACTYLFVVLRPGL